MAERGSLWQISMQQTASKHAIAIADLKLKNSVLSQEETPAI